MAPLRLAALGTSPAEAGEDRCPPPALLWSINRNV